MSDQPQVTPTDDEPQSTRRPARVALALVSIVVLSFTVLVLVFGAAAHAEIGCSSCHTMAEYVTQSADTAHAGVGCAGCHAATGVFGTLGDGVATLRMVVSEPFVDAVQPATMRFSNATCLDCHDGVLSGALESRGIAVRHEDFLDVPCTDCHAGTGHSLEGRHYQGPEMEDCTSCHRVSVTNLATCSTCHLEDAEVTRRDGSTAWRATHGPGWETAHGMGDLTSCSSCHQGDFCVKCHGVRIPHPTEWARVHGRDLDVPTREACATCHEPEWCTDCHGVEMPHPAGFLPVHGASEAEVGENTCVGCHDKEYCNTCHLASSHPDLPGVGMVHTP